MARLVRVEALSGIRRATLEFMPISSIKDFHEGSAIVEGVNRASTGLYFDARHYFRLF
jgi:hypothetical protein